jgi:uncharacterized protein YdaU (DUF1376 family)
MSEKTDSFIPFFGRDFLAATMGWPDAAVGAYIRLLIVQWEQGSIPADPEELAAIAHTVSAHWRRLEPKFPICDDGNRRNRRLEEHRAKADELKSSRKAKAKRAAKARWDAPSNAPSNARSIAQAMLQPCPPSPSPSPSLSSLRSEREFTHTASAGAGDEFRKPGWAAVEWEAFAATWNATKRAAPWGPLTPPGGWVDAAASPGWLDLARQAVERLPRCEFFQTPLAVTKFLEPGWVDRILAGEFDNAKAARVGKAATAGPLSLDEKLAIDRRESRKRKTWKGPPAGCPEDLAGRFFNQMLSQDEFEENARQALRIHRQRLQEAATRPAEVGMVCPEPRTTNGLPGANAEVLELAAESGETEYFDPVRDGLVGKDGRP